jgi:hypothetical protein
MDAVQKFRALRMQAGLISSDELDAVFDALPVVSCESILGQWKGGDFNTGHRSSASLTAIKWYGKTFNALFDAKPLICYDDNGELYSNDTLMRGEASLWMIEFRGKVSATMVYDGVPVFDHFRQVDERTLMGIMNGKKGVIDKGRYYYFFLERV